MKHESHKMVKVYPASNGTSHGSSKLDSTAQLRTSVSTNKKHSGMKAYTNLKKYW